MRAIASLCSNTVDHHRSNNPQSPRKNVQRCSLTTTFIPHTTRSDNIPQIKNTKPSLISSVQLPLHRNNNNTIRSRIRNLSQNIPLPNLLLRKKSLIVLIDRPLHQTCRRRGIRATPPRIRPLETSGFGAIKQVLVFCALESLCDGFGAFFGPGDGVGGAHVAWLGGEMLDSGGGTSVVGFYELS